MTRLYLFLFTLCAALAASAQYREGYYDLMDGRSGSDLKQAAKECVKEHTVISYSQLPDYWIYTDVWPELYGGRKRWWDMYSDAVYLIEDNQSGRQSFSANKMQREHCVPKSWWKKGDDVEYTPAYSDMWNLYPSDGKANGAKSNYPLGIVLTASFSNGVSKVGEPAEGLGGGASKVFEPADEYKGDFARAYMYVATVYDDINWAIEYMYEPTAYPTMKDWAIGMLLEWSRKDPVSRKEMDRNNAVEKQQGNRNPFVDFPALAEYIWGERKAEVFRIDEQGEYEPADPSGITPEYSLPREDGPVILLQKGGFIVKCRPGASAMRVYDISGSLLISEGAVRDGDAFSLPAGIYLVGFGAGKSYKIVIKE